MPSRFKFIALFALALLQGGVIAGVNEDLEARRALFESELAAKGRPQLLLYLAQLENLERSLADAENYEGAIRARDEAGAVREQIAKLSPSATEDPDSTNGGQPLVFEAKSATTSISVIFEADSGSLRGWRSTEDFARWQLPDLEPGGYDVFIEYVAGSSEGGKFVIAEEFFTLSGKVEPGGSSPVRKSLGTLKIRSGNGVLSIAPTEVAAGGLMRLKSIELVPAWR